MIEKDEDSIEINSNDDKNADDINNNFDDNENVKNEKESIINSLSSSQKQINEEKLSELNDDSKEMEIKKNRSIIAQIYNLRLNMGKELDEVRRKSNTIHKSSHKFSINENDNIDKNNNDNIDKNNNDNNDNNNNKNNNNKNNKNNDNKNNNNKNNDNKNNDKNLIINDSNNELELEKIIEAKLNKVKENILSKLSQIQNQFINKYIIFVKKIGDHISKHDKDLNKINPGINEVTKEYVEKNILDKLDTIEEIPEKIFKCIENYFSLLFKFLEQDEIFNQENVFEYFINQNSIEIINCFFMKQLNYSKINLSKIKNENYSNYLTYYLKHENENETKKSITIDKTCDEPLIRNNFHTLEKIEINNIKSSEFGNTFTIINDNQENEDTKSNLLKEFSMNNFDLQEYKFKENSINLNKLEKIKLKHGKLNLNYPSKIFSEFLFKNPGKLNNLILENIKLTDRNLKFLLDSFAQKQEIFANLKYLNLSKNLLTKVHISYINEKIRNDISFQNLSYFNLSKNNIYCFDENILEILNKDKFKVLDLTDNNITNKNQFDKYNKKIQNAIYFMSSNLFISNNLETNNEYLDYINNKLKNFKYGLKKLSLSYAYSIKNNSKLVKLRMSPEVKISLVKIDLSYCGLNTKTIVDFFKNNFGLFNLKYLNLNYNNLDFNFFILMVNNKIILNKLKGINLSNNNNDNSSDRNNENNKNDNNNDNKNDIKIDNNNDKNNENNNNDNKNDNNNDKNNENNNNDNKNDNNNDKNNDKKNDNENNNDNNNEKKNNLDYSMNNNENYKLYSKFKDFICHFPKLKEIKLVNTDFIRFDPNKNKINNNLTDSLNNLKEYLEKEKRTFHFVVDDVEKYQKLIKEFKDLFKVQINNEYN